MALDPQPTPTTTTTTTTITTRPLTNINTNTSPAQPARPVYVQNPHPHHQHHQIPHLYPQVRSPNPAQQGILYPVASSGRGFIPKPPLQNSVTVATNNNVTTAATTTTTTSGVGVGYPTRPLVSYPQVHVMRPPLHHLHQQHPTSQLPSATNPIKGIPISTHQKVAPPTSVSDYNGYKDPRDKSMDAFSRGKTLDESLYTIRDRKVNITPDASLYALCRSWLRNGISEEFQPQYGDVVRPFPKPLPISTASTHLSKKKEGEEEEEEDEEGDVSVEDLSPKDLLKRHVKHAKKVRARLREERLRRIARYKSRLALLLPPLVEQFRNDTAARN
ncbi:uncharacterized protein LOC126724106 [Quercus robur]|uniref:uncharacterized protein LOC126724106 n=1 Tax=Quercus robur TaxID=38942 RepID=UPI00216308D6|nr:uncharacterized protein LOC126724106 [Quercus robur]XP_050284302.1 uncharacterized protein LOC126724106 [Quercus robur]